MKYAILGAENHLKEEEVMCGLLRNTDLSLSVESEGTAKSGEPILQTDRTFARLRMRTVNCIGS